MTMMASFNEYAEKSVEPISEFLEPKQKHRALKDIESSVEQNIRNQIMFDLKVKAVKEVRQKFDRIPDLEIEKEFARSLKQMESEIDIETMVKNHEKVKQFREICPK